MTLPSISRALKTARGAVFAPRDADAGHGLFDSRTGHLYRPPPPPPPLQRVTFYARHLLKSVYKEKSTTSNEVVLFGDPYGNRTSIILQISFNAIRTNDNFITGMDFIKGYFYICVVQSVVLFI